MPIDATLAPGGQPTSEQRHLLREAKGNGCGARQIRLGEARVVEMLEKRVFTEVDRRVDGIDDGTGGSGGETDRRVDGNGARTRFVRAPYPHRSGPVRFELRHDGRRGDYALFELCDEGGETETPRPVIGLTDRPARSRAPGWHVLMALRDAAEGTHAAGTAEPFRDAVSSAKRFVDALPREADASAGRAVQASRHLEAMTNAALPLRGLAPAGVELGEAPGQLGCRLERAWLAGVGTGGDGALSFENAERFLGALRTARRLVDDSTSGREAGPERVELARGHVDAIEAAARRLQGRLPAIPTLGDTLGELRDRFRDVPDPVPAEDIGERPRSDAERTRTPMFGWRFEPVSVGHAREELIDVGHDRADAHPLPEARHAAWTPHGHVEHGFELAWLARVGTAERALPLEDFSRLLGNVRTAELLVDGSASDGGAGAERAVAHLEAIAAAVGRLQERVPAVLALATTLDELVRKLQVGTDPLHASESVDARASGRAVSDFAARYAATLRPGLRNEQREVKDLVREGFDPSGASYAERRTHRRTARVRRTRSTFAEDVRVSAERRRSAQASGSVATKWTTVELRNVAAKLLRYDEVSGAHAPCFDRQMDEHSPDDVNAERLGLSRRLDELLRTSGFERSLEFDGEGVPRDRAVATRLRDDIERLHALVVDAPRSSAAHDVLAARSGATLDARIKETSDLAEAARILARLGLGRASSSAEARAAVAGETRPTRRVRGFVDRVRRPGGEATAEKADGTASRRMCRVLERARQDDQLPSALRGAGPFRITTDASEAERKSLRRHWAAYVAHVLAPVQERNILGVTVSDSDVERVASTLSAERSGEASWAERTRARETLTVIRLLERYRHETRARGVTAPLSDGLVTRMITRAPHETAAGTSSAEAGQDRRADEHRVQLAERRRLLEHGGRRTVAGRVHRGGARALHVLNGTVSRAPDHDFRGPYAGTAYFAFSANKAVTGSEGLASGSVETGTSTLTTPLLAAEFSLLLPITLHGLWRKVSALCRSRRTRGQALALVQLERRGAEELRARYARLETPMQRFRARVLVQLAARTLEAADVAEKRARTTRYFSGFVNLANNAIGVFKPFWVSLAAAQLGAAARKVGQAAVAVHPLVPLSETATVASAAVTCAVQATESAQGAVKAYRDDAREREAYESSRRELGDGDPNDAVERAHHYIAREAPGWRSMAADSAVQSVQAIGFGGWAAVGTAVAVGALVPPVGMAVGGTVGGTLMVTATGRLFYKAGVRTRRNRDLAALGDQLRGVATESQKTALKRLMARADVPAGRWSHAAVEQIIGRAPELVLDCLLTAVQREMRPLDGEALCGTVDRWESLERQRGKVAGATDESTRRHHQDIVDRAEHARAEDAMRRIGESRTASYLSGLGVPDADLVAIADTYRHRETDALSRLLLGHTLDRVLRAS